MCNCVPGKKQRREFISAMIYFRGLSHRKRRVLAAGWRAMAATGAKGLAPRHGPGCGGSAWPPSAAGSFVVSSATTEIMYTRQANCCLYSCVFGITTVCVLSFCPLPHPYEPQQQRTNINLYLRNSTIKGVQKMFRQRPGVC